MGTIAGRDGNVGWLDSSTLAVLEIELGSTDGRIALFDDTGSAVGHVDGEFNRMLVSPGNRLMAVSPSTNADVETPTYRVWDNGALSDAFPGDPLAWSTDGSLLAVLIPTSTQSGSAGDEGSLVIATKNGDQQIAVPDWTALWNTDYGFSYDGRFLSACLAASTNAPQKAFVVDAQDGSVSGPVASDCYTRGLSSGPGSTLYISDGITPPKVWRPENGVTPFAVADPLSVTSSPDGKLAVWSNGRPGSTLQLLFGDQHQTYHLPNLTDVRWDPTGHAIAAISLADRSVGTELVLISVP